MILLLIVNIYFHSILWLINLLFHYIHLFLYWLISSWLTVLWRIFFCQFIDYILWHFMIFTIIILLWLNLSLTRTLITDGFFWNKLTLFIYTLIHWRYKIMMNRQFLLNTLNWWQFFFDYSFAALFLKILFTTFL